MRLISLKIFTYWFMTVISYSVIQRGNVVVAEVEVIKGIAILQVLNHLNLIVAQIHVIHRIQVIL